MKTMKSCLATLTVILMASPMQAQRTCPNGSTAVGDYGIGDAEAGVIVFERGPGGASERFRFGSEIVIRNVRKGSAGDGLLESGDVIVAIDDHLITTRDGSWMLTHPPIDKTVRMTIRRGEKESTVRIVPRESCTTYFGPGMSPRGSGANGSAPTTTYCATPSAQCNGYRPLQYDTMIVGTYRRVGESSGWIGVRFECEKCTTERDAVRQSTMLKGRPRVLEVASGSPADMAGVKVGDILIAVDDKTIAGGAAQLRLGTLRAGEAVTLRLERDGRTIELHLSAGPRPARD